MMVLQHSLVENPYTLAMDKMIVITSQCRDFPYAAIPLFISCFTTFYCLIPTRVLVFVRFHTAISLAAP